MVSQLEKEGETCKLVMLDGAPRYVSWYTEVHKQKKSTKVEEESYALAYFGLVCGKLDYTKVSEPYSSAFLVKYINFLSLHP